MIFLYLFLNCPTFWLSFTSTPNLFHIFLYVYLSAVPTVLSWQCKISLVFIIVVVSFLSAGYHAPLDLYPEFHRIAKDPTLHSVPEGRPVSVCVGKEWYRFPSSFLLPHKSVSCSGSDLTAFPSCWFTNSLDHFISSWQLHFIQSEFKGQLPQPFASGPLPTQIIPAHMNDQNLEEPTRYVSHRHMALLVAALNSDLIGFCTFLFFFKFSPYLFSWLKWFNILLVQADLRQCHYLVDLDTEEETPLEPRYSASKEEWNVIAYKPFLHASR